MWCWVQEAHRGGSTAFNGGLLGEIEFEFKLFIFREHGYEDSFHTYGCVSGVFQSAFAFGYVPGQFHRIIIFWLIPPFQRVHGSHCWRVRCGEDRVRLDYDNYWCYSYHVCKFKFNLRAVFPFGDLHSLSLPISAVYKELFKTPLWPQMNSLKLISPKAVLSVNQPSLFERWCAHILSFCWERYKYLCRAFGADFGDSTR